MRPLAVLISLMMLSGCAGVDLMAAGKSADLGDGVSVVPPVAWARIRMANGPSSLTIDGVGLGEIRYYTGIAPGQPIISVAGMSKAEIGTYNATMIPHDVMDLLSSNMEKDGCQNVNASDLAPAKFGATDGFQFNLSYLTVNGLEMKGEALIAQRAGKLDVLMFIAPTEYYFALRQPDAEQLFATIQVHG